MEKHKDHLAEIDAAYRKNKKYSAYGEIDYFLNLYWASPEIMSKWNKICFKSIGMNKTYGNNEKYLNLIQCKALIWFIRMGDYKAIEALPTLTAFPLFEEAKKHYLSLSPQDFSQWAKKNINEKNVPDNAYEGAYYYALLESAALIANDYELARNANVMLYHCARRNDGGDLHDVAASNLAFYVNKLGKVTDEDKTILTDYYNKYLKNQRISRPIRKRQEYVLMVLKKYHIVPDITTLPPKED